VHFHYTKWVWEIVFHKKTVMAARYLWWSWSINVLHYGVPIV